VACGQDSDFQRRQAIKICDVESENRQLKFDLESAQSINERKDARIRELVGALKSTLTPFQLANTHLAECMGEDYTVRLKYEQMTAEAFHQVQAALARSSEVPK